MCLKITCSTSSGYLYYIFFFFLGKSNWVLFTFTSYSPITNYDLLSPTEKRKIKWYYEKNIVSRTEMYGLSKNYEIQQENAKINI